MTGEKKPSSKKTIKKSKVVDTTLSLNSRSTRNSDNFRLELKDIQKPIVNLHRENDITNLSKTAGLSIDFICS